MNFRIIKTPLATLLLQRDQDEKGNPSITARIDAQDNTVIQLTNAYKQIPTQGVQLIIESFTQENAERLVGELIQIHHDPDGYYRMGGG